MNERLLTLAELAAAARCSQRTLERRVHAGELRVVRIGPRTVRVTEEEARRFLGGDTARLAVVHPLRAEPGPH
jgi:excisionase family DNA binding protein